LASHLGIIMALVNIILASSQLILAFAMVVVLDTEIGTIILVLGLADWRGESLMY
jgi:ABC-type dipeptide/oligopeptide/nickel transport system permease subunit